MFCASAVALTVTVSLLKLSVIEVAPEPVVMAIVLSVASPVVTESAPVSEAALILPISPLTTSAAEPASVSAVLLASRVASIITMSFAPLAVTEMAPAPVVIAILSSSALPVVTVERPGQRAGSEIADQPGDGLCRRACQRQQRVLCQCRCIDCHRIAIAARADRGRPRAGGDGNRVVGSIPRGHVQCPGQRRGIEIRDQASDRLCRRAGQSVSAALLPQPLPSAAALIVTVSFAPLAVIEVAPDPVVMAKLLSVASPVVRLSAPVRAPTLRLPTRPVTTSAAEPDRVSVAFSARAAALTVTTSLLPLAVIEVAPEPVVMAKLLSEASPVVTLSAPVRAPTLRLPTSPVTTSAAEPASVSVAFCASADALTVTVSLLKLVADRGGPRAGGNRNRVVGCIPRGHGECPGQRSGIDIADQSAHHFGCRACQRQRRIVGQQSRVDHHCVVCTARRNRDGSRAGGDRDIVVERIARGHVERPGQRRRH